MAFTEIYDRYAPLIYQKVEKILRDEAASKDLVQEVFIHLWEKGSGLDIQSNLGGYLYIAARSRVFQLIRRGKVRSDYLASLSQFASEVSMETLELLDERELGRILQQEISRLPEKMRQIFEMSRIQNLSHAEIAASLGLSPETVKKQVHNALKVLRGKLGSYGPAGWLILTLMR